MKHYWKGLLPLWLCISTSAQSVPARIDIVVVEGEGVATPVNHRVSADPVVRIEDDDHRPLPGAVVVFALPVSGTSGEFSNGSKTLTVVTDNQGLAAVHGLKTNEIPGKLQIYVTASIHGLRARVLINQTVEGVPGAKIPSPELKSSKSGGKWKWVVLGIVGGAGAGAGAYFATRNSGGSSPVAIGTGTVVFGSPR